MPNSTRRFKLNWASSGGLVDRRFVITALRFFMAVDLSQVMRILVIQLKEVLKTLPRSSDRTTTMIVYGRM
jgi:hypothetical protein